MHHSYRLPTRIPVGTKYILEASGPFLRRYVEFPSGRKVALATRKRRPARTQNTLGSASVRRKISR